MVSLTFTCLLEPTISCCLCARGRKEGGNVAMAALACWPVAASGQFSPSACERRKRRSQQGFGVTRAQGSGSTENGAQQRESVAVAEVEMAGRNYPPGTCQSCGKLEMVGGCNGQGRIQGGIGAVAGFGWWPIKAYRPCPAFVEAGGRYRRTGQSLEEVAFGRRGKEDDLDISQRLKGQ